MSPLSSICALHSSGREFDIEKLSSEGCARDTRCLTRTFFFFLALVSVKQFPSQTYVGQPTHTQKTQELFHLNSLTLTSFIFLNCPSVSISAFSGVCFIFEDVFSGYSWSILLGEPPSIDDLSAKTHKSNTSNAGSGLG